MKSNKQQERVKFLTFWLALLENGFDLQQSFHVMARTNAFSATLLTIFQQGLLDGQALSECFQQAKFSSRIVAQIALAEVHGNLTQTVHNILQRTKLMAKQQATLRKILFYPLFLFIFTVGILFMLRLFLFPQLLSSGMIATNHWGILLLKWSPQVVLICLCMISLIICFIFLRLKRQSILERATTFARVPVFGRLYQLYQTSYFALEWGNLFQQGLEIKQVVACLQTLTQQSLLAESAKLLSQKLEQGELLEVSIEKLPFLLTEFPLILQQGTLKQRVGEELILYNQLLLQIFTEKIERMMRYIQPTLFLLIALLILGVYSALFLPIYSNLGGVIS